MLQKATSPVSPVTTQFDPKPGPGTIARLWPNTSNRSDTKCLVCCQIFALTTWCSGTHLCGRPAALPLAWLCWAVRGIDKARGEKRCIPLCSDGWFAFFEKKLSRKKNTFLWYSENGGSGTLLWKKSLSPLYLYLHMFSLKYCLIQKEGIHCWRHLLTDYCIYILQRTAITLKWVLYNASYTSPEDLVKKRSGALFVWRTWRRMLHSSHEG